MHSTVAVLWLTPQGTKKKPTKKEQQGTDGFNSTRECKETNYKKLLRLRLGLSWVGATVKGVVKTKK